MHKRAKAVVTLGEVPGMSFRDFRETVFRVPIAGRLARPTLHREQRRHTVAQDERDPASGNRRWPEILLHWSKKTSKSTEAALVGLHHLVADPFERQDRRAGIASFDEEQSRIIFGLAKQIVERDRWLQPRVSIGRTEMVFRERVTNHATGGRYDRAHTLQALPRDVKGSHGIDWSMIIRDELWTEPDHAFSEALIISPTRANGLTLYLSYHAPRVMARAGVPLHDLLERVKAGDPTLFYSYIGGHGADAPWNVAPWISRDWVEQQRRIMASVPSRFRRVVLNEPAGVDAGLITSEELRASLVQGQAEPVAGIPGLAYTAALDLGLTNDWTALAIGHLDADARAVIDVVRTWRGSPDQPVDVQAVEDAIVALAQRFKLSRLVIDQWQAQHLAQRLRRRHVPAETVGIEQARLDRIVSVLKQAFSGRLIQINAQHTTLIEQLESVQVVETRSGRRDLLKFAPSGKGLDAGSHDDIVVAVGLVLERLSDNGRALGAIRMAEMPDGCRHPGYGGGQLPDCYLWGTEQQPGAVQLHAVCRRCEGHQSVIAAADAYSRRTGIGIDPRSFVQHQLIAPNAFVSGRGFRQNLQRRGLL